MKRHVLLLLLSALLALCATDIFAADAWKHIRGVVSDRAGRPVAGVVVSDGFTCCATDSRGRYRLECNGDAQLVYYSLPAEYAVDVTTGNPSFYTPLGDERTRYDFTLTPLEGGAEDEFRLFCLADPQCQNDRQISRFRSEAVPDVQRAAAESSLPCYGVTLGDVAFSSDRVDAVWVMEHMVRAMDCRLTGMPVFQTMGNHDNTFVPVAADEHNSTINIKFRRAFEAAFGPADYSWNRGRVHIVTMKDVDYTDGDKSSAYKLGFSDEQVEWLRQDLSYVPRDHMVILCVHIPICASKDENCRKVVEMLGEFSQAHIMAGHTHYNRNYIHDNGVYEHVHGAVCGTWWISRLNGDGTPYGYGVYEIDGATIRDWRYRGTGLDPDFQLRVYRGDAVYGGEYERFEMPYGRGVILANVWNADRDWTVEVYEDGRLTGRMEPVKVTTGVEKPSTRSSKDWWCVGYHIGVVGRGHKGGSSPLEGGSRKSSMTTCHHMYRYELRNPDAERIEVVATDRFGNRFVQRHVIEGAEYDGVSAPF